MKFIKNTTSELAFRTQIKWFTLPLAAAWVGLPLWFGLNIGRSVGKIALQCDRLTPDRVDCTKVVTTDFGLRRQPPVVFGSVTRAEVLANVPGFPETLTLNYAVALQFGSGQQETVFEDPIGYGSVRGDLGQMQELANRINNFLASGEPTATFRRDLRLTPLVFWISVLGALFVSGGIVMAIRAATVQSVLLHRGDRRLTQTQRLLLFQNRWVCALDDIAAVRLEQSVGVAYRLGVELHSGDFRPLCTFENTDRFLRGAARQAADFLEVPFQDRTQLGVSAQNLLDDAKATYSDRHVFERVSLNDFPHLDRQFYARATSTLESMGFRHVADLEDVTLTRVYPLTRTLIRSLLDGEGRVMAGLFDIPLPFWMKASQAIGLYPKGGQTLDLETELDDGTFLVTNNTKGLANTAEIPGMRRHKYPGPTPIADLVAAHNAELNRLMETEGLSPVPVKDFEALMEAQHRLQDIENRHHQGRGYMTAEDIRLASDGRFDGAAEVLGEAIEALNPKDSEDDRDWE